MIFVIHCGRLSFLDAFGAFRQEEYGKSRKNDPEVSQHAHIIDIEEVKFQFFVGVCVVFPIDLGVAGETGLYLQAEFEVRDAGIVFLRDLGPFGAGADQAHVPKENVEELWELIQAMSSHESSDRGDAVVIFAHAQAGHAVLFRINPHGPEFPDFKLPSVLREADLSVENGAAVIEPDGNGSERHDRAQDQNAYPRAYEV